MRTAQWIELSVGALNNKGVPKLDGCLKHQFQHWAHFAFFFLSPNNLVSFYAYGSMD
jgi:hypothetical protein